MQAETETWPNDPARLSLSLWAALWRWWVVLAAASSVLPFPVPMLYVGRAQKTPLVDRCVICFPSFLPPSLPQPFFSFLRLRPFSFSFRRFAEWHGPAAMYSGRKSLRFHTDTSGGLHLNLKSVSLYPSHWW